MAGPFKSQKTVLAISAASTATAYASATFDDIGGVLNIPEFGAERGSIDVTDLNSDAKEKLSGLPDAGSFSINLNYLESDAGQDAAQAAFDTGDLHWFRITLPSPATGVWHCAGFVKGWKVAADMDSKIAASITIELSGKPVWA